MTETLSQALNRRLRARPGPKTIFIRSQSPIHVSETIELDSCAVPHTITLSPPARSLDSAAVLIDF